MIALHILSQVISVGTRTAFLVQGERYISIHYNRSQHEQLGRVVISASPWPILFYGVVVWKN